FFIFHTDIVVLCSAVDSALHRLINIDKVHRSMHDYYLDNWWHLWKEQRKSFVNDIQNIVLCSKRLLSEVIKLNNLKKIEDKMGQDDRLKKYVGSNATKLEKPVEQHLEQFLNDFITNDNIHDIHPKSDLIGMYQYHFLFMNKIPNIVS